MEVFFDFGLFELVAAVGLAAIARITYSQKNLAIAFLILSVVSPAGLLVLNLSPVQRWIAVVCLATALVNAGAIAAVLQNGGVPRLRVPHRRRS